MTSIIDLSIVPTDVIVTELMTRKGVVSLVAEHFGCLYRVSAGYIHPNYLKNDKSRPWRATHDYNKLVQGFGPATILVIGSPERVLQWPPEVKGDVP
jgi:hypothetical protein